MLEWAPCSHFAWNQLYKKYISNNRGLCKSDSWPVYSFNDNFVRRLYHLYEENMMWLSSLPLSHWGKKAKIRPRLRILPWARFPESVEYLYSHFSHSAEKRYTILSLVFHLDVLSLNLSNFGRVDIFIGPKSDHCNHHCIALPCQSLHQSSCWDLIDVTLECEDSHNKTQGKLCRSL